MSEPAANPELLRSLGRLVRGLSALFWGLPIALLACVGTATGWLNNPVPALVATGLLFFGLWQMSYFQKQERPWRLALDRARLLGLVNFGLSPFLWMAHNVPGQIFFMVAVGVLIFSGLLFLFNLNVVVSRLGAMLPDETLRQETSQFTVINRGLLLALLLAVGLYLVLTRLPNLPDGLASLVGAAMDKARFLSLAMGLIFFLLLPLSITMALLWKTKEVIFDSLLAPRL